MLARSLLAALLAMGLAFGDIQSAGAPPLKSGPPKSSHFLGVVPGPERMIELDGVMTRQQKQKQDMQGLGMQRQREQNDKRKRCDQFGNALNALECPKYRNLLD
jgi:hypothetical protein